MNAAADHLALLAEHLIPADPRDASGEVTPERLSTKQRRDIVNGFGQLIGGLYAHLPQKRASYGFDPLQRIRLVGERIAERSYTDKEFHRDMAQIVTDLRDAHTRYLLPGSEDVDHVWFLPLLVERCNEDGVDRFLASKILALDKEQRRAFKKSGFVEGVEILHWNGRPMRRALDLHAEQETGGRPDARIARAIESLTIRPQRFGLPPDEDWVHLHFRSADGSAESEQRLHWRQVALPHSADAPEMTSQVLAFDPVADSARQVKKMLFAGKVWIKELEDDVVTRQRANPAPLGHAGSATAERSKPTPGRYGSLFYGKVLAPEDTDGDAEPLGYLRIFSFLAENDQAFIDEVAKVVAGLPDQGLIIDLRGNPGGNVWAAEGLLQLFSPRVIEPARFSMLASDMTRAMTDARQNRTSLAPWAESLRSALATGMTHSRPEPLTDAARCNNRGQLYPGPVVAIVDATTYSAGDLFAAGFVDNGIGVLICTDQATGGGGANVWMPHNVNTALRGTDHALPDLHGVSFTVSARRAMRMGPNAADIEDAGVSSPFRRPLTRRDLLAGNADLLTYAARHLRASTVTGMHCRVETDDGGQVLVVESSGLTRLSILSDGVTELTLKVPRDEQGAAVNRIPLSADWTQHRLELMGFDRVRERQRRLIDPG